MLTLLLVSSHLSLSLFLSIECYVWCKAVVVPFSFTTTTTTHFSARAPTLACSHAHHFTHTLSSAGLVSSRRALSLLWLAVVAGRPHRGGERERVVRKEGKQADRQKLWDDHISRRRVFVCICVYVCLIATKKSALFWFRMFF